MNPLLVLGEFCKGRNALLGDKEPVTDADALTDALA